MGDFEFKIGFFVAYMILKFDVVFVPNWYINNE